MKPYRTISIFSGYDAFRKQLKEIGVEFKERDTMSNGFWGKQFIIAKPRGKGAHNKERQIWEL